MQINFLYQNVRANGADVVYSIDLVSKPARLLEEGVLEI